MKKVLIADTVFVSNATKRSYDFISIFPSCDYTNDSDFQRGYEALKKRVIIQSDYYEETLKQILPIFSDHCIEGKTRYDIEPLIRPAFVNLTSLFLDRAIGILDLLNQQGDQELYVCQVNKYDDIASFDDLNSNLSWHWNQCIIHFIGSKLGLRQIEIFHQSKYPETPDSKPQKNFLFRPAYTNKYLDIIDRIFTRILRLQKEINNPFARFISVGFSGDDYYFLRNGFYGIFGVFRTVKFKPSTPPRNDKLRSILHGLTEEILEKKFLSLLNYIGLSSKKECYIRSFAKCYSEFIFEYFPLQNLEGLSENLQAASNIVQGTKAKYIIGPNVMTNTTTFLAIALKQNEKNGEVIGVQHGGHYGYVEAMASLAEIEYASCDKFLTWGWTEFDKTLPKAKAIKLPSPRLSNIDWIVPKNKNIPEGKILFMPNLLHRFPKLTTCGHSRIDFSEKIFSSRLALIERMSEVASFIDIKPYSKSNFEFAKEHYLLLEQVAQKNVKIIESTQKGLTASLIEGYDLIVWDQIGTGTLDCFVAGVPCLVYWDEIYSKPAPHSAAFIGPLREHGILHSQPESIAVAIDAIFMNFDRWVTEPSRVSAIKSFVNAYANTDPDWARIWKSKLREI